MTDKTLENPTTESRLGYQQGDSSIFMDENRNELVSVKERKVLDLGSRNIGKMYTIHDDKGYANHVTNFNRSGLLAL